MVDADHHGHRYEPLVDACFLTLGVFLFSWAPFY